jgi:hypothetical protein
MTFVACHLQGTARDGEKITTSWFCLTRCSSETQHPENLNVRNSVYGKYNYLSIMRFSEIVSHKFEVVCTPPRPLPSCKTNLSIVYFFLARWREDVTFLIRQYNIIGWILRYSQYLQHIKKIRYKKYYYNSSSSSFNSFSFVFFLFLSLS